MCDFFSFVPLTCLLNILSLICESLPHWASPPQSKFDILLHQQILNRISNHFQPMQTNLSPISLLVKLPVMAKRTRQLQRSIRLFIWSRVPMNIEGMLINHRLWYHCRGKFGKSKLLFFLVKVNYLYNVKIQEGAHNLRPLTI